MNQAENEPVKRATPEATRIGWIGTGVMGASMCGHLLDAGYSVSIYSRTRAKAEPLLRRGAVWCDSPAEVAQQSDVVFSIVGMPQDVREVMLGPEGVVNHALPGAIVVDMTTSQPDLAEEIAEAAGSRGVRAIDAPVSGGDVGAKNGALSIMVGGDPVDVAFVWPLFEVMGETIVHQGGPGAGQHAKVVNQILVGAGMIGVCESLLYAEASGLDLETVLQSVSRGAAGSWALTHLAPRIVAGNFDPGFFVEHFVKDLGIAMAEAKRMQLKLPGLELALELYERVQHHGDGKLGTHALQKTLAQMNGRTWPQS